MKVPKDKRKKRKRTTNLNPSGKLICRPALPWEQYHSLQKPEGLVRERET